MKKKKILIIEDDVSIAEIERDFLEINGFVTVVAANGSDGFHEAAGAREKGYDLILLDVMLPGLDGYEIAKRLRGDPHNLDIPILMVTAKTEDADKIRGLGLGADDYISKPFSPTELVARVKANIAQYERLTVGQAGKGEEIVAGDIRINTKEHRVYVSGKEIDLKNKEYELLLFLASTPGVIFGKETLYESIWGMDALGDSATVAVHINRLREKIEREPSDPDHIQTVRGVGYRFRIVSPP